MFVWELGDNFGHLSRNIPIAKALRSVGYDINFVCRNLRISAQLLQKNLFGYFQAPLSLYFNNPNLPETASYGEMLFRLGYADVGNLLGVLEGWINLPYVLNPKVIILDYAPIALLAARITKIPVVAIGAGFEMPPFVTPSPWRITDQNVDEDRIFKAESCVLNTFNSILSMIKQEPLNCLADLYKNIPIALTTFSELEHYSAIGFPRDELPHIGHIEFDISGSKFFDWPVNIQNFPNTRPKIFVYLRNFVKGINNILIALSELNADILCFIPNITDEQNEMKNDRFFISNESQVLSALLPNLDLVVNYAGAGTVANTLLAGVPMLLVPHYSEQKSTASQVSKMGAGIWLDESSTRADFIKNLNSVLEDISYQNNARKFQRKYCDFSQEKAVNFVVKMISEVSK